MLKIIRTYWRLVAASLIILTGLVLLFGHNYINFLNKKYRPSEPTTRTNIIPGEPVNSVTPESGYDGPVINYSKQGFSPSEINIGRPTCSLKITNNGSKPLTLRLGPYELSKKSNYGQKYPDIPPGGNILIDPRFGRSREEFLDYNQPEYNFYVNIDETCLPISH